MSAPLVIKFGGDALASPERIALAARRVGERRATGPVVAVASARRGVTDHLLGLVERVKEDTSPDGVESSALAAASDRAVAAGELVAASLLAVALNRLGIPANVLDAREAGLLSDGRWTRAQLTGIRPARIASLLRRGITPVVTGFQGWHRGRVTTLGRGGSDTTAVALAAAVCARQCELVKHVGGVLTADPRVVPEARLIPRASHAFLAALAAAGARVIALRAALLAGQESVPLRFSSLEEAAGFSEVSRDAGRNTTAMALRNGRYRFTAHSPSRISAERRSVFLHAVLDAGIPAELEAHADGTGSRLDLLVDPGDLDACLTVARQCLPRGRRLALLATGLTTVTVVGARPLDSGSLHRAARTSGAQILRTSTQPDRVSFLVPDSAGVGLTRALHTSLFVSEAAAPEDTSQPQVRPRASRREYVSQR